MFQRRSMSVPTQEHWNKLESTSTNLTVTAEVTVNCMQIEPHLCIRGTSVDGLLTRHRDARICASPFLYMIAASWIYLVSSPGGSGER